MFRFPVLVLAPPLLIINRWCYCLSEESLQQWDSLTGQRGHICHRDLLFSEPHL